MGDQALLDLAVPEELLRTAIARTRTEAVVADVALMPGVGAGRAPRLWPMLRSSGPAGLAWLAMASFLALTVDAGVGFFAPELKKTFDITDAGIGFVIFASSTAPFVLNIPLSLWADRGRRTRVAAVAALIWALTVPLMGLAPAAWLFALLAMVSGFGRAAPDSAHLSYLADAYPVEGRARILALHRSADPLARTLGVGVMGGIAAIAGGTQGWRWAMLVALAGLPVALFIARLREPGKGGFERQHVLDASGLASEDDEVRGPKVLLGSAVQRLLRIRSLYYQFVAVGVLGFAAVGIPAFSNIYLDKVWHLSELQRTEVAIVIGGAAFLGLPIAGLVGERLFRRSPDLPLLLAGASLGAFGVIYASALYAPRLWMVIAGFVLAEACLAPLATAITQTVAAVAPPAMRSLTFALFGIFSLFFGGFAGGVILGAISSAQGPRFALTLMGPITVVGGAMLAMGSRHVKGDITLTIEDILEDYQERQRRSATGDVKALQVHGVDFSYGTQQVLFDVRLEVDEGSVCALLGTNGAGKSTLLRVIAGLDHARRGTVRLFGQRTTDLEAEQIMALGVTMLPGGKMTFPSLSVEENLRAGSFALRRTGNVAKGIASVYETFPVLALRKGQRAGTLSGGEQQMLALGRALIHRPRLLLIDELTLGLAPKVVEGLLGTVRAINARGTTVVLVEQSINLALTLADRAFFLERGEVRFDGRTSDLLARADLLRPVFLGST